MRAPGGVVSALLPLLRRTRGSWFATGAEDEAKAASEAAFQVHPVRLPRGLRGLWYAGACNGALWPLAHGFVDRCRFRRAEWAAYAAVNREVAERVASAAADGAVVWVHDYQLALVPAMLRGLRPDLRIGFFWHIPWPPAEVLRVFPWAHELVAGLLGADLVGLHLPRYVQAFRDALAEAGIAHELEQRGEIVARTGAHHARVAACPIGVDAKSWAALCTQPDVVASAAALRRALGAARVLLSVDRLDYAKGVLERLAAFERALEARPDLRATTVLVQIGVPSRESLEAYRGLREKIEAAVGRINGRFGTAATTPVRLFAGCLSNRELAPWYVAADAALVTPLRDGMNLVALEYVAARPDRTGRLLLSTTAGAADLLREAWLVNPYDEDALRDAIVHVASTPEGAADAARMGALKLRVEGAQIEGWVDRFLCALDEAAATNARPLPASLASGA